MNDLRGSVDICKWHCTYNFKAGYCQCRFPSLAQDMRLSVQLQLKLIVVSSEHIDLHDVREFVQLQRNRNCGRQAKCDIFRHAITGYMCAMGIIYRICYNF